MRRSFLVGWHPETYCHMVFCEPQWSQHPKFVLHCGRPIREEKQNVSC